MPPSAARRWATVLILTLCGYLAGYNVGKVAAALPFVRAELGLTLFEAGTVASSYSVAAMLLAIVVGILVSKIGAVPSVYIGLALSGLAGLIGGAADSYLQILIGRVAEGIGYIMLAISIPILIAKVTSDRSRPIAMGIWGSFIPGGVALSMLISLLVQSYQPEQWRPLWWFACCLAVVCLILVTWFVRPLLLALNTGAPLTSAVNPKPALYASVRERDPLLLATCFMLYSMFFVSLVTYLPTVLVETSHLSVQAATRLSVFVVLFNILGNLMGGWLISRGNRLKTLLSVALLGACLFSSVVFADQLPVFIRVASALLACLCGGMLPASVFASVSGFVPARQSGLLLGVVLQMLGTGQVAGPVLLATAVELLGGWQWGSAYFIGLAVVCAIVLSQFQSGKSASKR